MDGSNSPNLSGSKRDIDEVVSDSEGRVCVKRRDRVFDENDDSDQEEEKINEGEGGGVTELEKVNLDCRAGADDEAVVVEKEEDEDVTSSICANFDFKLKWGSRKRMVIRVQVFDENDGGLRDCQKEETNGGLEDGGGSQVVKSGDPNVLSSLKELPVDISREEEQQQRVMKSWKERLENMKRRVYHRFARPLQDNESSENKPKLLKRNDQQQLITWTPSRDCNERIPKRCVPSLVDLCFKVLVNNADAIVSLEPIPEFHKRKLSNLLCDSRRMNAEVMDLFLRGSPQEIYLKDTSWITEDQFKISFGSFSPNNLRVLQFDLGGQCVSDRMIAEALARIPRGLPRLSILSLRGACRLTDDGLKLLVKLVPALCSINLGECSLLTHVGLNYLANGLGTSLREIYIDNCSRIDASQLASVLRKFKHLEVLSVARIPNVCDRVINGIVTACGRYIKYLDLADCVLLTDYSLKIIAQTCSDLRALNIENLEHLTDTGLSHLAYNCKSIRSLKLCRNEFSDEAIASYIDLAGRSLEELSLNHVSQVGSCTAWALAKFSSELTSLDLSWCRYVTDEALGLLVDSCYSLKLLKLFGCKQITNVFLDGHSNSQVRIIGWSMTPLLEHVGMLEAERYLRYSTLPILSGSQDSDDQDVCHLQ